MLAQILRSHHKLDLEAIQIGGFHVYHVAFRSFISYLSLVSEITWINGLYYWTNHRTESIHYFETAEVFLLSCYKMLILIRRFREIPDCLLITRFDFTVNGCCRDVRLLEMWQNLIILITSTYAVGCLFICMLYEMRLLVFRNVSTTMKALDGSPYKYKYRTNVENRVLQHVLLGRKNIFLFVFTFVMFDMFLITMCIAFSVTFWYSLINQL